MPPGRSAKGRDDATATLVRGGPRRPLGAVVRVLDPKGGEPLATHRLTTGRCVLGSGSGSDVVVSEATVSRKHAELELVPEGVRLTDLGSRNGTFYGGQRVERMVLSLGARMRLGAAQIAIDADTESLEGGALYAGDRYRGMIGASPAMRRLFAVLARLEGSLVTTLVIGESGTGKELVAQALHDGSAVSGGPIVTVNCGAIPRELVGSELFGHRRGAFTGAIDNRKGAFESADSGTLFLDEIGELPLDVQPNLLRVLETGEVRPVGEDRTRKVRVRVVAATNRELEEEVRDGRFREDLYYRLAVVTLRVPPLRERPEDVEPLARHFAEQAGVAEVPAEIVSQLEGRAFPGNVRELRNAVQSWAALGVLPEQRGVSGGAASTLDAALGALVDVERPYADQKEELSERFTRIYLRALLAHTRGNQTAAARIAGLDRSYLGRLLARHGLSRP